MVRAGGCRPANPEFRGCPGDLGGGGKIYVTGGFNGTGPGGGTGNTLNTVEAFDVATNSWQSLPNLPQSTKGHGQVTTPDGRVWAIGGQLGDSDLTTVQVYNPATNSWETKTPMQTGRYRHGLALGANGKIYAIGGYVQRADGSVAPSRDVLKYDPATNQWTKKLEMLNTTTSFGIAVAPNGKIWMTGGPYTSGLVEVYDPARNEYQTATDLPDRRTDGSAAFGSDGRLYAVGGVNSRAILATMDAGTIVEVTPTPTQTSTPTVTPTVTPTYTATPFGTPAQNAFLPAILRGHRAATGW